MSVPPRPDPDRILRGLKDFQRRTVDYVFSRLYVDPDGTRRFLIADEVGLGKTLVARGVTALALDRLWDVTERIDVVYICSNGDIARQNIRRLNVTGQDDYAIASRITLLPLEVSDLRSNKLNFLSLTPSTSFDLRSSLGTARERALLFCLLEEHWGLRGAAPLNVLQGEASPDGFRAAVDRLAERSVDQHLADAFRARVDQMIASARAEGVPDLRARFAALCDDYARSDARVDRSRRNERARVIGELRALLASACLRALEPDLIILDEFQRFKHLLTDDDAGAVLARELFNYEDENAEARVLLLSATPYKMYTAYDEAGGEDHYQDFVQTLRFLLHQDARQVEEAERLIAAYRRGLEDGDPAAQARAVEAVRALEQLLRRVMVRSERLGQSADRNGMLMTVPAVVDMQAGEAAAYVRLQRVADHVEDSGAMEYWKSAPYVLSFMEDYQLKREVDRAVADAASSATLAGILGAGSHLLLPLQDVERYRPIPDANGRLRWLRERTLDRGLWRLLWVPPTLSYHRLAGVYADVDVQAVTKYLVFSAWHVVPRAVATLLSYDAERRMMTSFESAPANTAEERRRRRPLLRFGFSEERWSGLPLFLLLYPSPVLARAGDLLRDASTDLLSLDETLSRVEAEIEELLSGLPPGESAEVDESWYWLAPPLLDLARGEAGVREWLASSALPSLVPKETGAEDAQESGESLLGRAVEELRGRLASRRLGARPRDLAHVLALAALAAPAAAAYRALGRLVGESHAVPERMNAAARIAWAVRSLFNQPEAIALLRGLRNEEPYWLRVLEYCANGGLGAVLDEYVHVLREAEGLVDAPADQIVTTVGERVEQALQLRASTVRVDSLTSDGSRLHRDADRDARMRLRFAMRFGDERNEDGAVVSRADQVRAAFNSPFWPFVVLTTSVGQEGLDFHLYSHAVVHWNLPSNPVDLEQREGRVHRYKGHAVRKNVARSGGLEVARRAAPDPWQSLFDAAVTTRTDDASDIVPYWVFAIAGGAQIERHVPALPLSRDEEKLSRLRRALVLYRLVFGQPRQEDLLAHLLEHHGAGGAEVLANTFRMNLEPPGRQEHTPGDTA